jgi:hypothetical protein
MIGWLNDNQGAVMAILTLVYVVATIILVCLQRRTLTEIRIDRELREKPDVQLTVRITPAGLIMFALKNYGGSPAKDISVDFSESFVSALPPEVQERLEKIGTARLYLVPGQEWLFGAMGTGNVDITKLPVAQATITYRDRWSKEIRTSWEFDFPSHGPILLRSSGIEQLTHELKRGLSEIGKKLERLS